MNTIKNLPPRIRSLPLGLKLGLAGITIAFVALASFYGTTMRWWGNADSPLHLDYVWQVSQGELPDFDSSVQYQPLNDIRSHPVQYVSQHPPLFYALMSVFMKADLETNNWHRAVAIGRAVNIFIGVLCILAAAWLGWTVATRRHKHILALAVPSIIVFTPVFVKAAGDIFAEPLLTLFSILGLGLMYQLLTKGPQLKYIAPLFVVVILGMATRVSFIALAVPILASLPLSYLLHTKARKWLALLKGLGVATLLGALLLLCIGWFYYFHNYLASGSLTRSGTQDWISESREYRSLIDIITNAYLYMYALFQNAVSFHSLKETIGSLGWVWFLLAIFGALKLAARKVGKRLKIIVRSPVAIFAILCGVVYGIAFFGQVSHATGYGQLSSRYFISALPVFALAIAAGTLYFKRLGGFVVTAAIVVSASLTLVSHVEWIRSKALPSSYDEASMIAVVLKAYAVNDLSPALLVTLGVGLVCGIFIASWAIITTYRKNWPSLP